MAEMIDELARVKSEVIAFGTAQEWLDSRWAQMNTCPPVPLITGNYGHQHTVNENIDALVNRLSTVVKHANGAG